MKNFGPDFWIQVAFQNSEKQTSLIEMHFEKSAEIVQRTDNLIETSGIFLTFLLVGLSPDFTSIPFQTSFNVKPYMNVY